MAGCFFPRKFYTIYQFVLCVLLVFELPLAQGDSIQPSNQKDLTLPINASNNGHHAKNITQRIKLTRERPMESEVVLPLSFSLCLLFVILSCSSSVIICIDGITTPTKRLDEDQVKDRKHDEIPPRVPQST